MRCCKADQRANPSITPTANGKQVSAAHFERKAAKMNGPTEAAQRWWHRVGDVLLLLGAG